MGENLKKKRHKGIKKYWSWIFSKKERERERERGRLEKERDREWEREIEYTWKKAKIEKRGSILKYYPKIANFA